VFPLKSLEPRLSFPVVTLLLITINVLVFVYQLSLPAHAAEVFVFAHAIVPSKLAVALAGAKHASLSDAALSLVTSMFLHAGWLHILGNMWFLWIFGANVEDRMGPIPYLIFYFICGIGSGIAQTVFTWNSHVPMLGASGAISGVLAAYIVFFPQGRILSLVTLFIIWFLARVPAWIFIGLWFIVQFLSGVVSLGAPHAGANAGGVAFWAHVGGFLLGLALARVFESRKRAPARR
jgi:membrane associated rhomboid family serine protease